MYNIRDHRALSHILQHVHISSRSRYHSGEQVQNYYHRHVHIPGLLYSPTCPWHGEYCYFIFFE